MALGNDFDVIHLVGLYERLQILVIKNISKAFCDTISSLKLSKE